MSNENQSFLEIDLQENGGKITFNDVNDVEIWLKNEREFWGWIQEELKNPKNDRIKNDISPIWSQLKQTWSKIDNYIKNAKNQLSQQAIDNLRNAFDPYLNESCLYSKTSKAAFILELKDTNVQRALFTLGYFIGIIELRQPLSIKGALEGILFEKGLEGHFAEKEYLQTLHSDWQNHLNQAIQTLNQNSKEFEALKETHENSISEQNNELEELISKYESEFHALTKTFESKLALQAPVRYWRNKKRRHLFGAIGYGFISLILFLVFGKYLVSQTNNLIHSYLSETGKSFQYIELLPLVIVGVIGFWIVRIFIKLFYSQVHLQIDANERAVMTETYLSLSKEKLGLSESEKQLILQNLFRPASSGIVSEDSLPSTPLEQLINFFKKKV